MSEDEFEKKFMKIADAFIDLANEHVKDTQTENVGMAILYAASRFNAFVVASNADNLQKYESDMKAAADFFQVKYQEMLQENLDDYKKIYKPSLKYSNLMKKNGK